MNLTKAKAVLAEHGDKPFRRLPLAVKPFVKAARQVIATEEANAAERRAAITEEDVARAAKSARVRADVLKLALKDLPPEPKPTAKPAPKPKPASAPKAS